MEPEKSINSFEILKTDTSPDYLWDNFFWQFVKNISELLLLCTICLLDIFNIVDFFQIFLPSTEILSHFWLVVYTWSTLKCVFLKPAFSKLQVN